MNDRGEVRSASEFKSAFLDGEGSYGPYKCPFCEVAYEDRCIVRQCVKAPHFKLPNGTDHRNGCNGESGDVVEVVAVKSSRAPKRKVVGDIEMPQALVKRRPPRVVKPAGAPGLTVPDAVEVTRRRRALAGESTMSTCYTTTQLRAIVQAFEGLKDHIRSEAPKKGLTPGTPAYNEFYRDVLASFDLSLYGQHLSYATAFQSHKIAPWRQPRISFGSGRVTVEGDTCVITDVNVWPTVPKSKDNLVPFVVVLNRVLPSTAPTNHCHALEVIEGFAATGQRISWHGYGLPVLRDGRFVLEVESLDDLYCAA